MSDAQLAAAAQAAQARQAQGYVVPLQNTTQQPVVLLAERTRHAAGDLREFLEPHRARRCKRHARDRVAARAAARPARAAARLRQSRRLGAQGPDGQELPRRRSGSWTRSCRSRLRAPSARAGTSRRSIDSSGASIHARAVGLGFLRASRCARPRTTSNDAEVKPYFELGNVLENGVFYAATRLYGITFKERSDIPVYQPDVRVFEVSDADGKPLALFYCDYFKRDNKNGGAWMSTFVNQSTAARHPPRHLQRGQSAEARAGRARAHQLRRCDDHVPRVRARTARDDGGHQVSQPVRYGHRP